MMNNVLLKCSLIKIVYFQVNIRALGERKSYPDPGESGWFPKFNKDFFVQLYVYDKIFTQIRLFFSRNISLIVENVLFRNVEEYLTCITYIIVIYFFTDVRV